MPLTTIPTVYWVLTPLPTLPVKVQVALPVFGSELLTRRTVAVQSVALLRSRFTNVTVAFVMSPGFESKAGSPVTAVMSCIVAMSVIGAVVDVSGIPTNMLPAYVTRASSCVTPSGVVPTLPVKFAFPLVNVAVTV